MNWLRYRKIRCVFWMIASILLAGYAGYLAGYRVNFLTPSVPLGIWKGEELTVPLKRGDYVCIDTARIMEFEPVIRDAHRWGYFGHTLFLRKPYDLLKQVGGVPGDVVGYDPVARRITINGEIQKTGILISADAKGRIMPRVVFPYRIPEGEYWLSSTNERGFDSRYFGSVPVEYITLRMSLRFGW